MRRWIASGLMMLVLFLSIPVVSLVVNKDGSDTIFANYARADAAIAQSVAGANAVIVSTVSFRTSPSTNAPRIRYLQRNEPIVITARSGKYWYAIKDKNGAAGYASSSEQYVKVTGSIPEPAKPAQPTAAQKAEAAIAAGMKYLGTPYEYASDRSTTTTFDCSDFVRQAFKDALGLTLPASSRSQGTYVRDHSTVKTDWKQLNRGDLMFFMNYKGSKAVNYMDKQPFGERISHVGIYLGNGQILHTFSIVSGGVRIDKIGGNAWEYRFLFGGSAL